MYDFPEERLGQKTTSTEPRLKVYVKSDQLTYSNQTSSAKGSRNIILNQSLHLLV